MEILKIITIAALVIYGILFLVFSLLEKRPVYTILLFMLIGVVSMLVINIISGFTGINIPLNLYTLLTSAFGGVPGVVTLLLLKIIFFV